MGDNLVKVKFKKTGKIKEVSSRIAYDKNYQASHDFTPLDGATEAIAPTVDPQKKIASNPEQKKVVAEISEPSKGEGSSEELGAVVETVNLEEETAKVSATSKAETVEETIIRLHKSGKKEQEIKSETGINMNTIRKVIKKIK